jgi:hypothetical protein
MATVLSKLTSKVFSRSSVYPSSLCHWNFQASLLSEADFLDAIEGSSLLTQTKVKTRFCGRYFFSLSQKIVRIVTFLIPVTSKSRWTTTTAMTMTTTSWILSGPTNSTVRDQLGCRNEWKQRTVLLIHYRHLKQF